MSKLKWPRIGVVLTPEAREAMRAEPIGHMHLERGWWFNADSIDDSSPHFLTLTLAPKEGDPPDPIELSIPYHSVMYLLNAKDLGRVLGFRQGADTVGGGDRGVESQ